LPRLGIWRGGGGGGVGKFTVGLTGKLEVGTKKNEPNGKIS